MFISAIGNQSSFNGVRKIVAKTKEGIMSKLLSSNGTDLGYNFVAKNGDIDGARHFADGVSFSYATYHLPNSQGLDSYVLLGILGSNKIKSIPNLKDGRYYLDTKYLKRHPELLTRKGLEEFLVSQEAKKQANESAFFTKFKL